MNKNVSRHKKFKELAERYIECLDEDKLNKIARESSFVQRSSNKVSGRDFVELMSMEHFNNGSISLEGLTDILQKKSPESESAIWSIDTDKYSNTDICP